MDQPEGNLLSWLTGGHLNQPEQQIKRRVQHPKVLERKDRGKYYWFFRYRDDAVQPDGSIKTTRPFHKLGLSRPDTTLLRRADEIEAGARRAEGATRQEMLEQAAELRKQGTPIGKREAESARDIFFAEREAKTAAREKEAAEARDRAVKPFDPGDVIIGNLAELWRKDYVDNPKVKLAKPTRDKYNDRLDCHILPRWKDKRLSDLNDSKAVLDWLQQRSSYYMMLDLRNIMCGMITRAKEWGIIPRSYANPMEWVKVGKKWNVRPDRIYTPEETAAVFARLDDPHLLICETCLYTGTRISEAVGLQLKHVDLDAGTIKIAQRHCRGDVDEPKTKNSKRVLALGALVDRYKAWIAEKKIVKPEDWIFPQDNTAGCRKHCSGPMWDSGVRKALKLAARACKPKDSPKTDPGLDFPGMGLHSFRRANITWRQGVGKASAIEASKIAGHATVSMTGDYTFVDVERQDETTRRIQERMEKAKAKVVEINTKQAVA
jgi:integrase